MLGGSERNQPGAPALCPSARGAVKGRQHSSPRLLCTFPGGTLRTAASAVSPLALGVGLDAEDNVDAGEARTDLRLWALGGRLLTGRGRDVAAETRLRQEASALQARRAQRRGAGPQMDADERRKELAEDGQRSSFGQDLLVAMRATSKA